MTQNSITSTVLITGASGGIGSVLATRLEQGGARLVLTARNGDWPFQLI